MTKQFIHISTPFVLGLYAALSAVWIIVGDILLRRFAAAGTQPLGWETAKGLLFVALSAGVLGWFGVQRDRADARNRLRARELHESDERYRALFEGSSSLIMIIDVKTGEIIHANPAAAGFYGYSLAEMVSLRYSDLGVGGIEQWQETLRCVQEERETRLEVEHRLKDGSVRALRCNIGSLVLNDRQRLYCIAYDVTEQRRTDLALRLRSAALGAASNGVVITDRHGSIEWVNSAFTGLTGYGQHEVVGANPRILKSGVQDEAYYREMWETVAAGQVWQGELVNRRKDGSQYVEEQSITPVRDAEGEIHNFISIRQDVTEKRAARDELERRARQQRALAELGQRALSGADLADLMQESARVTAAVLDVDFVSVLNLGPDHQSFVLQAGWGWPEGTVGHFEIANEPSNQAGFTVRSGEPVVSDDLQGETRFRPIPILMEYGVSSSLGVQIDYGEVMFGILSVHAISRRQYSHSDIAFLQGVANVLAAAIRQRRFEMELGASNQQLLEAYDATIEGWAMTLDLRDHETEGHSRRVTDLSVALGRSMGLGDEQLLALRRGALLHDIGKMGVPDTVLHKAGTLTEDEWVVMRSHAVLAKELLGRIAFLGDAVDVPYCHHEKWDGTGYPRGLRGEEIPLNARIFALVDVYDALTSDRPYRKAWTSQEALNHIGEQSGRHFDPDVVVAFLEQFSTAFESAPLKPPRSSRDFFVTRSA